MKKKTWCAPSPPLSPPRVSPSHTGRAQVPSSDTEEQEEARRPFPPRPAPPLSDLCARVLCVQERRGAAAVKDLARMAGVGDKSEEESEESEKSGTSDESEGSEEESDEVKTLHDARHLYKGAVTEYLVEWVGYPARSAWTWEPEANLGDKGVVMLPELKRALGDKWPCKPGVVKKLHDARRPVKGKATEYLVQWDSGPHEGDWTWEPKKHIGDAGVAMLPELARRLGDKWPCKKVGRPSESAAASPKVSFF